MLGRNGSIIIDGRTYDVMSLATKLARGNLRFGTRTFTQAERNAIWNAANKIGLSHYNIMPRNAPSETWHSSNLGSWSGRRSYGSNQNYSRHTSTTQGTQHHINAARRQISLNTNDSEPWLTYGHIFEERAKQIQQQARRQRQRQRRAATETRGSAAAWYGGIRKRVGKSSNKTRNSAASEAPAPGGRGGTRSGEGSGRAWGGLK